ncbi:MAG TPA: quinolinate synthase [Exilispira sp.]|nr:quinolinate synthase [Exilispira sp.]
MELIELKEKIYNLKEELKDKLIIAAHHYQNKDIVDIADFVGDSYMLAKKASETTKENIVLCGVRFMAETAKIIARNNQKVFIPEINSLCPLAEKVNIDDLKNVYNFLKYRKNLDIVILTYVNSYVDIKSFTGEVGGSCCTSSNAEKIIKYYLNKNKKIIFVPDFYLASNTANKIKNIKTKNIFIRNEFNLNEEEKNDEIDLFLWNGFCPVHQVYSKEDIINFKEKYPDIKVVVHPESKVEVVSLADYSGSTEYIYNLIKNSEKGSIWAVGTESTFVNRIQLENLDKKIFSLKESYCKNMQKINLDKLYNLLLKIKDNNANDYEIKIKEDDIKYSLKSLQNMIDIVEGRI